MPASRRRPSAKLSFCSSRTSLAAKTGAAEEHSDCTHVADGRTIGVRCGECALHAWRCDEDSWLCAMDCGGGLRIAGGRAGGGGGQGVRREEVWRQGRWHDQGYGGDPEGDR